MHVIYNIDYEDFIHMEYLEMWNADAAAEEEKRKKQGK